MGGGVGGGVCVVGSGTKFHSGSDGGSTGSVGSTGSSGAAGGGA